MLRILFVSLIATTIFGICDSGIFLIGEVSIQDWFVQYIPYFDRNMAELLTGGLSAAVSLFFATLIRLKLSQKYNLIEHPLLDASGILLGTVLTIGLYFIIRKKNKNKKFKR